MQNSIRAGEMAPWPDRLQDKCTGMIFRSVILALMLSASSQADGKTACLPDGSTVRMTGVIKQVLNRDKHTDQPYSYFIVDTEGFYCLSGPDVDERSSTPTYDITVVARVNGKDLKEFGPYVGYRVVVTGKLSSSNWGGPLLFDKTIKRIARDN